MNLDGILHWVVSAACKTVSSTAYLPAGKAAVCIVHAQMPPLHLNWRLLSHLRLMAGDSLLCCSTVRAADASLVIPVAPQRLYGLLTSGIRITHVKVACAWFTRDKALPARPKSRARLHVEQKIDSKAAGKTGEAKKWWRHCAARRHVKAEGGQGNAPQRPATQPPCSRSTQRRSTACRRRGTPRRAQIVRRPATRLCCRSAAAGPQ